jgi:hypothetical protein
MYESLFQSVYRIRNSSRQVNVTVSMDGGSMPALRKSLSRSCVMRFVASITGAALCTGSASAGAQTSAQTVTAPFCIDNYFFPGGFMGDGEVKNAQRIVLNDGWTEDCHSGPTCIRIVYKTGDAGFGGVYWLFPDKNWGDEPGRVIENAKKVVFWARGEKGGELVDFKVGGVRSLG